MPYIRHEIEISAEPLFRLKAAAEGRSPDPCSHAPVWRCETGLRPRPDTVEAMPVLAIAVVVCLLVTVSAATLAARGSPRLYWLAAFAAWCGSFLTAWSIGLYLLVFTFVFLALAAGHACGWIRGAVGEVVAGGVGVLAWGVAISTIDDYWLFLPFGLLGRWLSS